jgi:phosphoenolpyruvate carboxykinase (GTP)
VDAVESPIGYLPKPEDINTEGLNISAETLKSLLSVDVESWKADILNILAFYNQIGDHVPIEMYRELAALAARLG